MKCSNNFYTILIALLVILLCSNHNAQNTQTVYSPNGQILVEFLLDSGSPKYNIKFKDITIINNSTLGFRLKEYAPIEDSLIMVDFSSSYYYEKWATVWGTDDSVTNEYNDLNIFLKENSDLERKFRVHFKVYDDGVGFRYEFPDQPNMDEIIILDELTEFNLTGDHKCWWIPGDYDSYEYLYNTTNLSEINLQLYNYETRADRNHPNDKAVNTPITMETDDGLFLSFHEANLTDYAGMTLEIKENLSLEVDLVPWSDGSKVKTKTPFNTPWRTIQIVDDASNLMSSNLILNLNEPTKFTDVSWIEPMKYIGIWWEMHLGKSSWSKNSKEGSWANSSKYHGANTENAKSYIDFASENNIQGLLIEGWNTGWEYWGSDSFLHKR